MIKAWFKLKREARGGLKTESLDERRAQDRVNEGFTGCG